MHPTCKLLWIQNSGLDVFACEVAARILRHDAIQRKISSLGAHKNFIAIQFSGSKQLRQSRANVALRTLVAIINRGIEKVDARAQSSDSRLDVGLIGGIVRLAQIGPEPNGREPQMAGAGYVFRTAEVSGGA